MALPCPGPSPISLLDIQNEFGGANPIGIDEYYRGGVYVPNTTTNVNIPTSGIISFDKFFCSSTVPPELVIFITTNTANLDVRALFEATYPGSWTSTASKRLVINSGVIVYGTSPLAISNLNGYAIKIYDTFNGTFTLQNFGSIEAAAGRRGNDTIVSGERRTNQCNGGDGGNAIYIGPTVYGGTANSRTVFIENRGTIYCGGGGGGGGAAGFAASPVFFTQSGVTLNISNAGAPGAGGFGGWGQGFGQVNTAGTLGGVPGRKTISLNLNNANNVSWNFPTVSDITIISNNSIISFGEFGSSSNISYSATNRSAFSLTFAGANSNISLSRNNHGARVTKASNQAISDSGTPALNVSDTGFQNPTLESGPLFDVFLSPAGPGSITQFLTSRSGRDGAFGGSRTSSFGLNSSSCFAGSRGYSVVGTRYVSYIVTGTVVGNTQV